MKEYSGGQLRRRGQLVIIIVHCNHVHVFSLIYHHATVGKEVRESVRNLKLASKRFTSV